MKSLDFHTERCRPNTNRPPDLYCVINYTNGDQTWIYPGGLENPEANVCPLWFGDLYYNGRELDAEQYKRIATLIDGVMRYGETNLGYNKTLSQLGVLLSIAFDE